MDTRLNHMIADKAALRIALERLLDVPGAEKLIELPDRIRDVVGDTRFGGVEIIVSEGRITRLKAVKSYP